MFPWQSLADCERVALREGTDRVLTWRQLNQQLNQLTQSLTELGVTAGSGFALCGKNSLDLLLYYLAGLQLNARVLGINPAFSDAKVRSICKENQIDFLFSSIPFTGENAYKAGEGKFLHCKISKEQGDVLSFLLRKCVVFSPASPVNRKGATLTLTSGSSGSPKAVVHTIDAHLANAQGVCELTQFQPHNSWLLSLPLYHVSGQGIVWRWLLSGAELHLPGDDFYASVLNATHVSLVPTQAQRLLQYIESHKISQFRTAHILLGGTLIPVELTQKLTALGIQSYTGYGMTEMASTVFAKISDGKKGVGQALRGREYRLVNDEIWLRGAGLADGYWQNGKIVSLLNEQGWFQTKDKGYWFDDELIVIGRVDNMFISGGENIQPEEIEAVIQQYELVRQAFVLPIDDSEFGQRPVAFVAFSQTFSAELTSQLQKWLSDKIEKFKQPVAYYALNVEQYQQQGNIKISRQLLKNELNKIREQTNE
ncbi:2-succinylbenzoyl-CoA synthetase [Cricetibacter osteomyelitidis]|uniref:2-succinylbenzoyl-CoA synthetase n=1 Tax=Cricetibacter osteomyelitidis TaxID=1521931 RepID=A0A4R2TK52_9PAST|nr:o-succinylbenzoate--CoA ligase [Cricetibacter osteomyelitidis]TCP97668.1 2-succinylbenzoyl-CoA synthetase [Cricetibacter osteomyelitidis]